VDSSTNLSPNGQVMQASSYRYFPIFKISTSTNPKTKLLSHHDSITIKCRKGHAD